MKKFCENFGYNEFENFVVMYCIVMEFIVFDFVLFDFFELWMIDEVF